MQNETGICTSGFDYDYKILKKLHDLEVEIEAVKKTLHDRVAFMAELSHDLTSFTKGATIYLHVMKNNEQVNYLFLENNVDFHHHRSVPTVLEIAAGDQVKVIVHGSGGTPTLLGCCFHTHFSGYSLNLA
ncbi:hypothetical protein MAR_032818 [Mya arenaria]|uniref:Uncharacterized protein n=1 Tax=Mya arenaria TaxID=6604 RepID=A0ABY7GB11_MYAAR|nr:hypothetical protein MAR_032818 [Mya arenaria]